MPTDLRPDDLSAGAPKAPTRWFAMGTSALGGSEEAGAKAAQQALRGGDGKLTIVFASGSHDLAALVVPAPA